LKVEEYISRPEGVLEREFLALISETAFLEDFIHEIPGSVLEPFWDMLTPTKPLAKAYHTLIQHRISKEGCYESIPLEVYIDKQLDFFAAVARTRGIYSDIKRKYLRDRVESLKKSNLSDRNKELLTVINYLMSL